MVARTQCTSITKADIENKLNKAINKAKRDCAAQARKDLKTQLDEANKKLSENFRNMFFDLEGKIKEISQGTNNHSSLTEERVWDIIKTVLKEGNSEQTSVGSVNHHDRKRQSCLRKLKF